MGERDKEIILENILQDWPMFNNFTQTFTNYFVKGNHGLLFSSQKDKELLRIN